MADLITIDQFEARTGRTLTATQTTQAEALITDASALVVDIVNNATTTDTWTSATVPASVVPVVASMVQRAMDNPLGHNNARIDDYAFSTSHTSGVFATRHEAQALRRAAGTSGIASLNLESDLPLRNYDVWLDGAL